MSQGINGVVFVIAIKDQISSVRSVLLGRRWVTASSDQVLLNDRPVSHLIDSGDHPVRSNVTLRMDGGDAILPAAVLIFIVFKQHPAQPMF